MNRFIYKPAANLLPVPTEMLINPLSQIEASYTPVYIRFHFLANDCLIDVQTLEILFANQRACDLVGASLMFCKLAENVYPCCPPYMNEHGIWLDVATELTKLPLASGDLINMYDTYFNNTDIATYIKKARKQEK